ncbi:MAG: hypothetical protein JO288_09355 [Hyphomicrobiales bacterium]|nr:hypothetical protein [Hyphomicrobiales bacterium]
MRLLARFLGLITLAGAFAAAVLDGARWIANGAFAPTTAGAALGDLAPRAIASARTVVEARLGAWAWDDLVVRGLALPVSLYLTALSALWFVLSQRRRDPDW